MKVNVSNYINRDIEPVEKVVGVCVKTFWIKGAEVLLQNQPNSLCGNWVQLANGLTVASGGKVYGACFPALLLVHGIITLPPSTMRVWPVM